MDNAKFIVNIADRLPELDKASEEQIKRGLTAVGGEAEGKAKDDCPVDTGRLKNSITFDVVEKELHLGTNVEYAIYVETNDTAEHKSGKAHFLRDAIANNTDRWVDILKAALS